MNPVGKEFQQECQHMAARVALMAAESLPLSQRVMVYRGVVPLFADHSEELSRAKEAAAALETADQNQLRLFELLES